jgi:hypothetical protein
MVAHPNIIHVHNFIFNFQISVKYAHDERTKHVSAEYEKAALKAMLNNKSPSTVMKHFRKNEKYKTAMLDVIKKEIEKEICILVKRNGEVFQNQSTQNLLAFDWIAVYEEFKVKAPILHSVFCGAAAVDLGKKKKLPSMITSASILLYTRSQNLNQLQYIMGLIADKCGLTKEVMKCHLSESSCKLLIIVHVPLSVNYIVLSLEILGQFSPNVAQVILWR